MKKPKIFIQNNIYEIYYQKNQIIFAYIDSFPIYQNLQWKNPKASHNFKNEHKIIDLHFQKSFMSSVK